MEKAAVLACATMLGLLAVAQGEGARSSAISLRPRTRPTPAPVAVAARGDAGEVALGSPAGSPCNAGPSDDDERLPSGTVAEERAQ